MPLNASRLLNTVNPYLTTTVTAPVTEPVTDV